MPEPLHFSEDALVWYAQPEKVVAEASREALLDTLSLDERARHGRFRFEPDRDAFLVAHALTRCLLARLAGVAPSGLVFRLEPYGRPEIAEPGAARGLSFNLTHTRGLVACAAARGTRVGIDAENIERQIELLTVARHVFSTLEMRGLEGLVGEPQRCRFFELWTLKEAYVKALGKGLVGPLRAISFLADQDDPVPAQFDAEAADDAAAWCFRRHAPGPNHRLAVALRARPSAAVSFQEVDASRLLGSLLE